MKKILLVEDRADVNKGADLGVDEDLDGLHHGVDGDGITTSEPAITYLKPMTGLHKYSRSWALLLMK